MRTYVGVVYWAMTLLLLVAAIIIAAFSIPTDIRQQTIHTIITKPVERFEILLGRFLGFTALMTLVLLLMTTLSVVYVLRGIDPAAAAESLKAREPLYGDLHFENTGNEHQGTNVGREWDYRSYISTAAPNQPTPYAVWNFASLPRSLADRKTIRCEFTFDIYRTTKGFENRGLTCRFQFQTAHFDKSRLDQYSQERTERLAEPGRPSEADIDDQLAEKYRLFRGAGQGRHRLSHAVHRHPGRPVPQRLAGPAGPDPFVAEWTAPRLAGARVRAVVRRSMSAWPSTTSTCGRTTPTPAARRRPSPGTSTRVRSACGCVCAW